MFEYLVERYDRIAMSQSVVQELESAFCGVNRDDPSEMVTQSLLQSKNLITQNKKQTTESLDSAVCCVDGSEKKKQRIGVRLTIAERQAFEIAAQKNSMTLSHWIRQVAQNSAQQKSA